MAAEPLSAQASQIVVISGTGYDPKKHANNNVLATETDSAQIAEICLLLEPVGSDERFDWMEWPSLSLVVLARRAVLAEYGLLSRAEWASDGDSGYYPIAEPDRIRSWLADRGVDLP